MKFENKVSLGTGRVKVWHCHVLNVISAPVCESIVVWLSNEATRCLKASISNKAKTPHEVGQWHDPLG